MKVKDQKKGCSNALTGITGKLPIRERPLLTADQATEVVALFQVLANDSRLRMLHVLTRAEETCVGDLAAAVEMAPQAVSNQLRRLIDRRIVAARRDGNRILYRIIDPCVPGLLELGVCLAEETGLVKETTQPVHPFRAESSKPDRKRLTGQRAARPSKK
jgi:DNA-binding transcriptional ArsR family regulator